MNFVYPHLPTHYPKLIQEVWLMRESINNIKQKMNILKELFDVTMLKC